MSNSSVFVHNIVVLSGLAALNGEDPVALVALLRSLPAEAALHAVGWDRMTDLARTSERNRTAAGEAGACAVLVMALTQHSRDATVAQAACACRALYHLTVLPANQVRAGAAGAAAALVGVMQVLQDAEDVQYNAVLALDMLTECAANVPGVAAVGGRAAIAQARHLYQGHGGIQARGANLLKRLPKR